MDITPELLLDIWKKGKTLDKAALEYADNEIREKYIAVLNDKSHISENELNQSIFGNAFVDGLINILGGMGKAQNHAHQKQDAETKLYTNLFEKITAGQLIALGFKYPVQSDYPVLIPAHMWPPENKDINTSSISAHGINFVRIRINKNHELRNELKGAEINIPKYEIKSKKVGRPSSRDKILEAYELLDKDGQIDPSKPLKDHYPAIRNTIKFLYPDIKSDKNFKNEVIRKTIAPLFNAKKVTALKSTHK